VTCCDNIASFEGEFGSGKLFDVYHWFESLSDLLSSDRVHWYQRVDLWNQTETGQGYIQKRERKN
jgi:hypothetical protein